MAIGPEYGLPYEPKPYHKRVFCLEELIEVAHLYGTPQDEANIMTITSRSSRNA
jgi:hypothetical protein